MTSVSDYQEPEIRLYPNPSLGMVNIELGEVHDNIDAQVINLAGKMIKQENTLRSDRLILDLKGSTGVVLIRLSASEGLLMNSRVLIK